MEVKPGSCMSLSLSIGVAINLLGEAGRRNEGILMGVAVTAAGESRNSPKKMQTVICVKV